MVNGVSMRKAIIALGVGEAVDISTKDHSEIAVRSTASNLKRSHDRVYEVNRIEDGVRVKRVF